MSFSLKVSKKLGIYCLVLRQFAKRANPGISNQINAIEDAVEVIKSDPEGFAGLESDLFNVHKSHKEHELEQKRHLNKIKMHMIKNKYFRTTPLPNLLTYAEKEHIRYLHSCDPEEWTFEKLSESFPANAEVISKIVNSRWSALSAKRITSHDANVIKNWERFKNGEYKEAMPNELDEHIKKFAVRNEVGMKNSTDLSKTLPKKQWQKPKSIEFSSIITGIRKKNFDTNKDPKLLENKAKYMEMTCTSLNRDTYIRGQIKNKKPITIHELKSKHSEVKTNDSVPSFEGCSSDHLSKQKDEYMNETAIATNNTDSTICATNGFKQKFELNEIVIDESDRKLYEIVETKERIRIPRKLWRKGATYRAYNCYYDDDGEFLYKVPGMH